VSELIHYSSIDLQKTQELAYESVLSAADRGAKLLLDKAKTEGDDGKSKLWAELVLGSSFVELLLQASKPFQALLADERRDAFVGAKLAALWHKTDKCESCRAFYSRDLGIYGTLRTVADPEDLATAELLVNKWFEIWLEDTI